MLTVEGYKAFHGDMKITPADTTMEPYYICDGDWLYKPSTNCWYSNGCFFPAEVCEIVKED